MTNGDNIFRTLGILLVFQSDCSTLAGFSMLWLWDFTFKCFYLTDIAYLEDSKMESMTPARDPFLELMEPTVLYNLLNQAFEYPSVSDPSYLLLIGLFFTFILVGE